MILKTLQTPRGDFYRQCVMCLEQRRIVAQSGPLWIKECPNKCEKGYGEKAEQKVKQ